MDSIHSAAKSMADCAKMQQDYYSADVGIAIACKTPTAAIDSYYLDISTIVVVVVAAIDDVAATIGIDCIDSKNLSNQLASKSMAEPIAKLASNMKNLW